MHLAEADNRPKSQHRYNVAEQQNVYKSEIERIWKAQFNSLSRKEEPELTAEDEQRHRDGVQQQQSRFARQPRYQPKNEDVDSVIGPVIAGMPSGSSRPSMPPNSPTFSRASSMDRDGSVGPDGSRRVLRIKRFVRR